MTEEKERESIFLLNTFDGNKLQEFFEFSANEGPKVIFLCSNGGKISVCAGMLDVINRNPEEYTIRVSEMAFSSAFNLLIHSKCKIEEIAENFNIHTFFMYHGTQNLYQFPTRELKETMLADERDFKMIEHVLTKKQIRKHRIYYFWVSKWKQLGRILNDDLYISKDQMLTLLGGRLKYV